MHVWNEWSHRVDENGKRVSTMLCTRCTAKQASWYPLTKVVMYDSDHLILPSKRELSRYCPALGQKR